MAWARPAEWITMSTSRKAAAMLCGEAMSPITALDAPAGTSEGRRSSTLTR
jgi:hypothetical protein